jgi:hypothetical protein
MDQSDHDILVSFKAEVGTKLDRAIYDIRDLKDNLVSDVAQLKAEKASQKQVDDIERRLTPIERYYWIAVGALAIIDILISYYIHNH